ncbi:MAG: suppressor of fused domain protein [Filimonas sp.]|nr:suppressor of fused domain protein [Filimonas sp.]
MPANILLETQNVRNTLLATVEQNDQTVYFYIWPGDNLYRTYPMRACWVRNIQPAPVSLDLSRMEEGLPPMMPAGNCDHPEGAASFDEDHNLEIVWFEEDDGAALLQGEEVLAIIPGWSLYMEHPVAYAQSCTVQNEQLNMFPLENDNALLQRLDKTFSFWNSWNDDKNWDGIQSYFLSKYEGLFGAHTQYFAIDGNKWPPMALVRFKRDQYDIFLTLGVSIRPMPWVDFLFDDASGFRRIELGVAIDNTQYTEQEMMQMAQFIAGMADSPWNKISWLGEGHTIDSQAASAPCTGFILSSAVYNGPSFEDFSLYDDKINLLWAVPIHATEMQSAISQSNGGFMLLEKLIEQDVSWVTKRRNAIL